MNSRLIAGLLLAACFEARAQQPIAFEHVRLIDGTGHAPYENATLVIRGDRIVGFNQAVPEHAIVYDATGRTIIPGLVNAHGHLGVVEELSTSGSNYTRENIISQLQQYLRFGVTGMLALGLNRDVIYRLRDEQRNNPDTIPGAVIFTAGRGIGVPGGAPPLNVGPDQVYRPGSITEAIAAVREMASHSPDMIKIWVDDLGGTKPKMAPEMYAAVIDEAHRHGLRVAAHIFKLEDAKALVARGVDVIAHSVRDVAVDEEFMRAMKERGVWYVPTLELDATFFLFADHPDWLKDPFLAKALDAQVLNTFESDEWRAKTENDPQTKKERQAFAIASANLKRLYDADVHIAMGTDSGATPLRVQGYAEHLEMALMNEAGVPRMDVLVAATDGSASAVGAKNRGVLAPGNYADFVMLDANPLDDIKNTRGVRAVWHDGQPVH